MLMTNALGCACAAIAAVALTTGAINSTIMFACLGFGCGIAAIFEVYINA